MENVLPVRHRSKANNLLHMATTKLPVLWIIDFVHHMRSQTPIESVIYLWEDLYRMQMETSTESDRQFLIFLQDVVMEWVVEHHTNNTLVDFYFYNYLLLHFKCIPYSTWTEEDKNILMRYLEEHSVSNMIPILERMNLEIRQVCQ
jgi:hypothetical protein